MASGRPPSRIHLVGPIPLLEDIPGPVLQALRAIRNEREGHLAQLSEEHRRMLVSIEHLIASYVDVFAQINSDRSD